MNQSKSCVSSPCVETEPSRYINPRQLLHGVPVVEAFLFGLGQRLAQVAAFVEVFREAAFGASEANEVIDFVHLRFDVEILFLGRIVLKAEAKEKLWATTILRIRICHVALDVVLI